MSKEPKEKIQPIRGTQKTFTHFVTVGTTTIWEMRSKAKTQNEHLIAYRHLIEFIGGLPQKIKKELLDDIKDIDEQIAKITNSTSADIHTTLQLQSNEIAQLLGFGKGRELWFKMNDLLDEAGYKEIPEISPRYPTEESMKWKR